MFTSSISTSPSTRPPAISSCMRFRQRTKVDFPHPDGPMMAVAPFDSMVRVISWSACERPYQTFRLRTSIATAYSFAAWTTWNCGSDVLLAASRKRTRLPNIAFEPPRRPAYRKRGDENEYDKHERAGEGLVDLRLVRAFREGEDRVWKRFQGLSNVRAKKRVAKGGHQERGGLAGHARHGQHDACDDAAARRGNNHAQDGARLGRAQGKRRLAQFFGYQAQHLLRGASHDRDHDNPQGHAACQA